MHGSDWIAQEAALAARLPARLPGASRVALLADLGQYSRAVVAAARAGEPASLSGEEIGAACSWLMRPVFICGHHRSGTTLLHDLLDGHPELFVLPGEATYFSSFSFVARGTPGAPDLDRFVGEWVERFVDPNYPPHFKLGRSTAAGNPCVEFARRMFAWQAALHGSCPQVPQFSALLALAAACRDIREPGLAPRMWVEKTPLNERYLGRFAGFSAARFIHLVRSPPDSLASLLQALRAGGIAAPDCAAHSSDIGHSLQLAAVHARRYPQRYLVVKYEDLTANTGREMERVRAFLGIRPHGALLTPTSGSEPVSANSSFAPVAPGVVGHSARGEQLEPGDVRVLSASAGHAARVFGYELPRVGHWFRFAVHLRDLPHALLRRLRIELR